MDKLTAYKAFDEGMVCREFTYEVGKTYEHKGDVSLCNSGFHACEIPFDCWGYYPQSLTFARVTLEGVSEQTENDSKRVAAKITIEATLSLPEWIKRQVEIVIDLCKAAKGALTSGEKENAATTGNWANAATTGYRANAATTGNWANAATTGKGANAATTGKGANAATTGEGANAATTGEGANAATTGNWANAATTGEGANAATTGYRANAATTGNWANAATTGKNSIAACLGMNGKAKAGENGCIVLTYWDEKAERPRVVVGYVRKGELKADTWYQANAKGKIVEAV